jgi:hypothetical protein
MVQKYNLYGGLPFSRTHNEIYDVIDKMRKKKDTEFNYKCNGENILNLTCDQAKILKYIFKINLKKKINLIINNEIQIGSLTNILNNIHDVFNDLINEINPLLNTDVGNYNTTYTHINYNNPSTGNIIGREIGHEIGLGNHNFYGYTTGHTTGNIIGHEIGHAIGLGNNKFHMYGHNTKKNSLADFLINAIILIMIWANDKYQKRNKINFKVHSKDELKYIKEAFESINTIISEIIVELNKLPQVIDVNNICVNGIYVNGVNGVKQSIKCTTTNYSDNIGLIKTILKQIDEKLDEKIDKI